MPKKPVMLLFHPGGFVFGDPALEDRAAAAARKRGFRPRSVDYTLGNLPQAVKDATRTAKRLRRKGREVYAYGDSAGGTLAATLAQRGLVRSAAAHAPVSSVPGYLKTLAPEAAAYLHVTNPRKQKRLSPVKNRTRNPILTVTGNDDDLSRVTRRWAKRDKMVRNRSTPGGHLQEDQYGPNMKLAMKWLANQRKR